MATPPVEKGDDLLNRIEAAKDCILYVSWVLLVVDGDREDFIDGILDDEPVAPQQVLHVPYLAIGFSAGHLTSLLFGWLFLFSTTLLKRPVLAPSF
jgi:hypothetical protein